MKFRIFLLTGLFLMSVTGALAQLRLNSLTTDYKTNPVGMDNPVPRLGWIIESEQDNTMQVSYEIRSALSPSDLSKKSAQLWNTGTVSSSQSIHIKYQGQPLQSNQRVYWQVRITDNHGKKSKWSDPAFFEMGKLKAADWAADWISPTWEEDPKKSEPSPYLRKEFSLGKAIKQARLYISCQGLYQVEINGSRVGDQEFTPGWTSYDTRLQYQTYDITSLLNRDRNAIGIVLGDGWFRGNLGWIDGRNNWGEKLAAIAELVIEYTDGTSTVIGTDESWKASKGPILESDIYNGELYDAGKELSGWSKTGYDDSQWTATVRMDISKEKLIAPEGPPVKIVNQLEPLSLEKREEGWLVDMGQNMVGWIRIKASGNEGDVITLRHAEVLDKEGNMYYDNLRAAKCTNTYILKGGTEESFEPHFTFQGFRYVMVSGYPG